MPTRPPGDEPLDDLPDPDPVVEARLIVALRDLVDDELPSPELRNRVLADLEASTPTRPSVPLLPIAAALLIAVITVGALVTRDRADDIGLASDVTPQVTSSTGAAPGPGTCRDSLDRACGAFRWDPAPADRPATLTATLPDGPILVDRAHELTLVVSDPDGRVDLQCYSVSTDRPALTLGTCVQENPGPCPERYGPWTPPAPEPHEDRTTTVIRFQRTGTYVVDVAVPAVPGCDNVEPFRSEASTRLVIDVVGPTETT